MEDIRICFVGDSLVNGTGDETALGWAGRLCSSLNTNERQITYYNLGVRRDTSRDILQRWEKECLLRLPDSVDSRVIFSFGVNDAVFENEKCRVPLEESLSNFQKILSVAKSKYKVLMVGPPPVHLSEHNQRIRRIHEVFQNEALKMEISYIDIFSHLIADEEYIESLFHTDGAHPHSQGYIKLAKTISTSESWRFFK